jgi:predicted outer membrane repeat protein
MRKRLLLAVLMAAAFGSTSLSAIQAAAETNNNLNTDCRLHDLTHPFVPAVATSLQSAVDQATAGDVLGLHGLCHGDTVIDKSLTIKGTRWMGGGNFHPTSPGHASVQELDGDGLPGSVVTILPCASVMLNSILITGGTGGPGVYGQFGDGYTVGGGIDNAGNLSTMACSITQNSATAGGGIYMEGGTFSNPNESNTTGNTAVTGGGMFVADGAVNVGEMRIFGNAATEHGGGVYVGGGVFTLPRAFFVRNNTPDNVFTG